MGGSKQTRPLLNIQHPNNTQQHPTTHPKPHFLLIRVCPKVGQSLPQSMWDRSLGQNVPTIRGNLRHYKDCPKDCLPKFCPIFGGNLWGKMCPQIGAIFGTTKIAPNFASKVLPNLWGGTLWGKYWDKLCPWGRVWSECDPKLCHKLWGANFGSKFALTFAPNFV